MRFQKSSLALLALVATFAGVGATVAPSFAWSQCSLTLSPSNQTTSVTAGQTITLTYLLHYVEGNPPNPTYASNFVVSTSVTAGSPSGTWTILSVTPPNPVPSTEVNPVSQIVTVKVQAPSSPVGSTASLTIKAVNTDDSYSKCSATTRLTTVGSQTGVPQFPLGMLAVVGVALPALVFFRRKFTVRFPA